MEAESGVPLVVQWLGPLRMTRFNPWSGTKISLAVQHGPQKEEEESSPLGIRFHNYFVRISHYMLYMPGLIMSTDFID